MTKDHLVGFIVGLVVVVLLAWFYGRSRGLVAQ